MSTNEALSNGADDRVKELELLFARDPSLLAFCSKHYEDQMFLVLEKLKEKIPAISPEDVQTALKLYAARHRVPAEGRRPPADELKRLRDALQSGLIEVVGQIERGYRITMAMYTAAFIVGILLLLVSTFAALFKDVRSATLLGGLGVADIITFLIFKPAQDLQASRGSLAQFQAAFFAWVNDIHNWNEYLDLLQNEAGSGAPSFDKCKEISEIQGRSTEQMARLIGQHTQFAPGPKSGARARRSRRQTPDTDASTAS
jgi:hypothetical protein